MRIDRYAMHRIVYDVWACYTEINTQEERIPYMTNAHRLGFYHTFLANKNDESSNKENEQDNWEGLQVAHHDTPILGLEVFVEYQLRNSETNEEMLFTDDEYMPLHHYIDVSITNEGLVFSPNDDVLRLNGYTLDYKPAEYYTVVKDAYTFESGPYEGLTVQMPTPHTIDKETFDSIVSQHLDCFLNADNDTGQTMAYNRVTVKG